MRPSPHEQEQPEQVHPGEFFSALLKQLYIGQPYVPRNLYVPVDFEDREALEDLLSEQVANQSARAHARAHSCAAARRQAFAHRSRRQQCQAVLRSAFPRAEAERAQDSGRIAGSVEPSRAAEAHRVLRHLPHSGRGDRRVDGGLGRRQDEESRLSQIHHPHGGGRGRFRLHARGGDSPLQAPAGRKRSRCQAWS